VRPPTAKRPRRPKPIAESYSLFQAASSFPVRIAELETPAPWESEDGPGDDTSGLLDGSQRRFQIVHRDHRQGCARRLGGIALQLDIDIAGHGAGISGAVIRQCPTKSFRIKAFRRPDVGRGEFDEVDPCHEMRSLSATFTDANALFLSTSYCSIPARRMMTIFRPRLMECRTILQDP